MELTINQLTAYRKVVNILTSFSMGFDPINLSYISGIIDIDLDCNDTDFIVVREYLQAVIKSFKILGVKEMIGRNLIITDNLTLRLTSNYDKHSI